MESGGVLLRRAVAGDLARVRALASSDAAEPWLGVGAADQLAGAMDAGELRVVEHPPGAAIGAARLVVVNRRSRIGEVKALMLEPRARGRGLAVAALRALAAEAFGPLGLHRLQAEVYAFNEASLRAFDRAGFRREGVRRAAYDRHGAWQSSVLFGLLAEEAGRWYSWHPVDMDQVRLGDSGLHVSRVCLGMMSYGNDSDRPWVLDERAAEPIVRRAVEGGITFFDTADVYSAGASEVATGRLLRDLLPRDELVVATKVHGRMTPGPNGRGLSRKHILSAIEASLGRLGMDYVDLYQIHRWDPHTPIEETMEALHDVVKAGKARYVGASSMFAWQFAKAQRLAERHGWTPFVSMQNHYNLLYREEEREMIPQCLDMGVGVLPWSPLARGWLAGTRTREGERRTTRAETDAFQDDLYGAPEDFDVIDRLVEVARERGVPPPQVALAWLLHKPGVTAPIVGATKLEHLEDALAAAELALSEAEIRRVEEPYRPHPVLGH